MPRLVLLNGLPASGKSTLAARYVERHPLTLRLDLDVVRGMLGEWFERATEAGLIARRMAIEMARVQLADGRDVIVPQYLGQIEFVLELEQLSRHSGATFVEIVLGCGPAAAAARFDRRSRDPQTSVHRDAARLVERDGGPAAFQDMQRRLAEVVSRRPRTLVIDSQDDQIEHTYEAIERAIEERVD